MSVELEKVVSFIFEKGTSLLLATLFFALYQHYISRIVSKFFDIYQKKSSAYERRINTFYRLFLNLFKYLGIAVYTYIILSIFGVPVTTLMAGAGILSIGIGLGAQSFFNDTITGFFIVLEKQFDVGDYIVLENVEGYVIAIGIRTTQIKSNDGVLTYVPNRKIGIVNNLSKSEMRISIDIPIYPDKSIFSIEEIIEDISTSKLPQHPEVKEKPSIQGLTLASDGNFYYRVTLRTRNANQTKTKAAFYQYYITGLISEGIIIPDTRWSPNIH
ncbi:mechanosensitive ion channel family protein [Vagococcus fluvialis]|uniref:mechanosensitive ion channel family protein n=1 Tax=Vagococcus fluvialis TaxID=2738 RepID=UPI003D14F968